MPPSGCQPPHPQQRCKANHVSLADKGSFGAPAASAAAQVMALCSVAAACTLQCLRKHLRWPQLWLLALVRIAASCLAALKCCCVSDNSIVSDGQVKLRQAGCAGPPGDV